MRKKQWLGIIAFLASLCATQTNAAQSDCWNLAHKYCCETSHLWEISCEGGLWYCYGYVPNGINGFKQTLVDPSTGAMTGNSFTRVGAFYCEFHPRYCPWCDVLGPLIEIECSEFALKTQWAWCDEVINP